MSRDTEQVYLRVIGNNLYARQREEGYGGETEEVSRRGSSTHSSYFHSKQHSLPSLHVNPSPFLAKDQSSSELPSFDEAPTSFPSPSLQPDFHCSALQSQMETEGRTSATSLDLPTDFKEVRRAYITQMRTHRDQIGVLPITAYCPKCQSDVSTRVSVDLPGFLCWETWSCCTDLSTPRYQDVKHYCRRCRSLLAEFQPN